MMANLRALALLVGVLAICALCCHADATAFEVGGDDGWVVPLPPASEGGRYNKWASKNRFLVGDIVHFMYKEDSVMVVTETDYDSCNVSHPIFFSNNGDTAVELDHPGPIYFISGENGHCERGQRMVITVVGPNEPPPAPTGAAAPAAGTTAGALAGAIAAVAMALPVIVIGV